MKLRPPIRPKKSLGQHFLRDQNITRKIVAAVHAQPTDVMFEIGPGEGALTKDLAPLVRTLVVVDIDTRVTNRLSEFYATGSVEVLNRDFLETDLAEYAQKYGCRLRVVGNIPYNITSPILFHLLDNRKYITDATIMMQKEVALRLVAVPKSKDYGILSVFFQMYTDVTFLFEVSPNAFYPKPRVISSVVQMNMLGSPRYAIADEWTFREMVRSIFGKRRKTLRNSLLYFLEGRNAVLPSGADLQRRPEDLTIEELASLSNTLVSPSNRKDGP